MLGLESIIGGGLYQSQVKTFSAGFGGAMSRGGLFRYFGSKFHGF